MRAESGVVTFYCIRPKAAALPLCVVPDQWPWLIRPFGCRFSQIRHKNSAFLTRKCTCQLAKVAGSAEEKVSLSSAKKFPLFFYSTCIDLWEITAPFFPPQFSSTGRQLVQLCGICFPGFTLDFVDLFRHWPFLRCLNHSAAYANPSVIFNQTIVFCFRERELCPFHVVPNNTPVVMWHLEEQILDSSWISVPVF